MKLEGNRSALGGPAKAWGAVMTFQTHGEYYRPAQQPGVRRAVRIMADFAAFDANRRVLINERTAFFCVAFDASLLIALYLFHHGISAGAAPSRCERAVRVMTIATGHHSFVDAVLERHGELGANIGVTSVAQLRLHFRQQKLRRSRRVDGVATGAHNIVFGVS